MLIRKIITALRALVLRIRNTRGPEALPVHTPEKNPQDGGPTDITAKANKLGPSRSVPRTGPIIREPGSKQENHDHQHPTVPSNSRPKLPDAPVVPEIVPADSSEVAKSKSGLREAREEKRGYVASGDDGDSRHTQSSDDGDSQNEVSDKDGDDKPSLKRTQTERATQRKPREIGGRRGREAPRSQLEQTRAPSSLPELVCRRVPGSGLWEVVLSANDDCRIAAVSLDGEQLDATDQECRLSALNGPLCVLLNDGRTHEIPLFENAPLVFKLRKNWSGVGRKISRVTKGHFIIFAPNAWERTRLDPPVEPDGCTDTEFLAHYFYRDAASTEEGEDGFKESGSLGRVAGIKLTGRSVFDNSTEGELFVEDPPELTSSPHVVWARVGEEAEHGWKGENFEPSKKSIAEILSGKEGHFFLRVYDAQARLFDSGEFRFSRNLREVYVNDMEYTQETVLNPSASGYAPLSVRFTGADDTTICPVVRGDAKHARMLQSGILKVPPHPDADRFACSLGSGNAAVKIVLDLPRLWWRLEDSQPVAVKWLDKPLSMTREEFKNHARNNATLVLLEKRQASVRAGLDDHLHQRYSRKMEDNRIVIHLAHFVDYRQIDQRLDEDAHLNVEWAGKIFPVIRISADPVPAIISFEVHPPVVTAGETARLSWDTKNANTNGVEISPAIGSVSHCGEQLVSRVSTTTFQLKLKASGHDDLKQSCTLTVRPRAATQEGQGALVKRSGEGGFREGKGFSQAELKASGVTRSELMQNPPPGFFIDTRRRTVHQANIDMLRRLRGA